VPVYQAALEVARGRGRRGKALIKELQPLAGQPEDPGKTLSVEAIVQHAETGGDPAAGELIYRRAELSCTLCHAIGGVGGTLGPDLSSLGASAPLDYLVESLVHPERKVKEGYHAVAYQLKDGSLAVGIPSRSTADHEFIQHMGGEQAIAKDSIQSKAIAGAGGSLMPAGLIDSLNRHEIRNLVSFLRQLGKPGPFDASDGGIARLWTLHPGVDEALATRPQAAAGGLELSSLVDGRCSAEIVRPYLGAHAVSLAQARFVTARAGRVRIDLEGVSEAWVNGEPVPVASEPGRTLELGAGTHLLTVKLRHDALPPFFRASSKDVRFLTE